MRKRLKHILFILLAALAAAAATLLLSVFPLGASLQELTALPFLVRAQLITLGAGALWVLAVQLCRGGRPHLRREWLLDLAFGLIQSVLLYRSLLAPYRITYFLYPPKTDADFLWHNRYMALWGGVIIVGLLYLLLRLFAPRWRQIAWSNAFSGDAMAKAGNAFILVTFGVMWPLLNLIPLVVEDLRHGAAIWLLLLPAEVGLYHGLKISFAPPVRGVRAGELRCK